MFTKHPNAKDRHKNEGLSKQPCPLELNVTDKRMPAWQASAPRSPEHQAPGGTTRGGQDAEATQTAGSRWVDEQDTGHRGKE